MKAKKKSKTNKQLKTWLKKKKKTTNTLPKVPTTKPLLQWKLTKYGNKSK